MSNEFVELKELILGLDKRVDIGFSKFDPIVKMVERHERILVRQNGTPALVDKVEDLGERLNEIQEQQRLRAEQDKINAQERRKFYYALTAMFIGVGIDLFLRLTGIM